jgi:hypothetical protein
MKTIGRNGSSSEYTVFDANSFIYRGVFYNRDIFNGRYYRLEEPCGFYSRIGREGGMARKRISAALFSHLFNECEERISKEKEKWERIFKTEKEGAV